MNHPRALSENRARVASRNPDMRTGIDSHSSSVQSSRTGVCGSTIPGVVRHVNSASDSRTART